MVNESQLRTFIISDKTREIQSFVRACSLRTAFIRWWMSCIVHVSVILSIMFSKFDRVATRITKRAKREREPSRVLEEKKKSQEAFKKHLPNHIFQEYRPSVERTI